KAYEVDTVLWFQPPKHARETALRLGDLGIRLIGIAHEQVPAIPCRYEIRRDRGIGGLLAEWRLRNKFDSITIAQWDEHRAPVVEEALHSALEELGIRASIATFSRQRSETFLRTLAKARTDGIVFASA